MNKPCEILSNVNIEEFKAVYPLHRCLVDGDGCVFSALSIEIHHQLLGLVDVEREVVLLTPFSQGTHLLSVGHLIFVSDQAYHRCVISKFGAVCDCTGRKSRIQLHRDLFSSRVWSLATSVEGTMVLNADL